MPLEEVFRQGLPLDEEKTIDSKIRIHFWARALSSPDLAEQQAVSFKGWIRSTRALLRSRQKSGEVDETVKLEPVSEVLTALIIGVGVMAVFLPEQSRRGFVRRVIGTVAKALL